MIFAFVMVILGFIGLAVGSFLTVVTDRLATGEQIIWGRSHCPHCRKLLRWFELLPVASFLLQHGRCRSCSGSIPKSYLVIEVVTAVIFASLGAGVLFGVVPTLDFLSQTLLFQTEPALGIGTLAASFIYYAFFASFAVAISAFDFKHRLIPRSLVTPLIFIGSLKLLVTWVRFSDHGHLLFSLIVAGASFSLFWSLWFFSKGRAMGRGDADIALAIALYLGPYLAIAGLLLAFWSGSIWGILWIATGKLHFKSEIPFAPFLFGGAILALFLAEPIIGYLSLFG